MAMITVELPDATLSALRRAPAEMSSELRLAASLFWYSRGVISQERGAELAGLTRAGFINACAVHYVEAIVIDIDEVRRELGHG